jgi:peptidyl-Lys metalloendopeptidase
MQRAKILLLVLIVFVPIGSLAVADTPLLSSTVEVLDVQESNGISVRLKFTLKNESENPIDILKWGTPLEGEWTNDCFDVRHDGRPVPYVGMLVKRGTPGPDDYIRIGANQEVSGIVDLEKGYEIYQPGEYTVHSREGAITAKVLPDAEAENIQAESLLDGQSFSPSNEAEFILSVGLDAPVPASYPLATCTDVQKSAINAALPEARRIASTAKHALHDAPVNLRPQAQRYREWFGAYTSSRYSAVSGHFDRISDALASEPIYAICVDQNIFAKVNPSQPYIIYFGNLFWSAPLNGTDSKAGTFVHEMSHFYVVAGTKDHVYGQTKARNLADIDPDMAINNADNHEYFAENNPPLSMPGPSSPPPPPSSSDDDDGSDSGGCFIQSLGH